MASPSTCSDHIQASPPRMFASREGSEFALDGLPFHLFRPHTGFASKNVCLQRGLRVCPGWPPLPLVPTTYRLRLQECLPPERAPSLPWMASPSTCSDHIQASPPRMFASRE